MLWAQVSLAIWLAFECVNSVHAAVRLSKRREWPKFVPWLTLVAYLSVCVTAACAGAFDKVIGWPS